MSLAYAGRSDGECGDRYVTGLVRAAQVTARTVVTQQLVQVSDRRYKTNEAAVDAADVAQRLQLLQVGADRSKRLSFKALYRTRFSEFDRVQRRTARQRRHVSHVFSQEKERTEIPGTSGRVSLSYRVLDREPLAVIQFVVQCTDRQLKLFERGVRSRKRNCSSH